MNTFENPIPQETPPPRVRGTLSFSCCGKIHTTEGDFANFYCPICFTAYAVSLATRQPYPQRWPRGTKVRVVKEIVSTLGCKKVKFEVGEEVIVGHDPHGILSTIEDTSLVEVSSPSMDGKPRILLSPVPNECLEEAK
jgi:hypothetical protein